MSVERYELIKDEDYNGDNVVVSLEVMSGGDYVKYTDYAALEARLKEAEDAMRCHNEEEFLECPVCAYRRKYPKE
jgi:hypothetical protein